MTGENFDNTDIERRRALRQKKKLRQKRRRRAVLLILLAVIGLAVGVNKALNILNADSAEAPQVSEIDGIPVTNDIIPKDIPGRPGETRKVKYIVIHETGNTGANANAKSHNEYIHSVAQEQKLSWHYTVDDHSIYHHLPDNEIGYHAGDGDGHIADSGNANGIGVELCVNPENDYEQTLANAAALTAHLMRDYNLNLDDVKKHQDFSGKNCPENLINSGRWDEFLQLVQAAYDRKI